MTKRNRAIDRRKSNPERNQIRTNIQRTGQHDRKSLECTFRNRLPYQTGKTTRKDENRLKDFCKACEKALKQIKEKHYDQKLEEGYETILNYGIACYKKRCKVMVDNIIKLFMPQSYPQCTALYVLSEHSAQTKVRKKAYIQLI